MVVIDGAKIKENVKKYSDYFSAPPSTFHSYTFPEATAKALTPCNPTPSSSKVLFAIIKGDLVDVAIDWYDQSCKDNGLQPNTFVPIPIVNMANKSRAGGDWDVMGKIHPEECLCRRSIIRSLLNTCPGLTYPLGLCSGIYSPSVGM